MSATIPSEIQARDLTIVVHPPIWSNKSYAPFTIDMSQTYSHKILATGGYWDSKITFNPTVEVAEDWFADGLGRHIVVYAPDGLTVIFEGFVDKISVGIGTLSADRGPLLNVSNKVNLIYCTVDTSTVPPIVGNRSVLGWSSNTDSQSKYGILEKVLSSGGIQEANAVQVRDTYLTEHNEPESSETINFQSQVEASVTLSLKGYVHLFRRYYYSDTTTGTRTITLRLQDIIGGDPSTRFSSDYVGIDSNATTINRYTNDLSSAWQLIKSAVNFGDASYNRYVFGIYENRRAKYNQIPSDIAYYHNIGDNKPLFTNFSGVPVEPWLVNPAKWVLLSDWLVGKIPVTTSPRDDLRAIFIESVDFSTPYGLQITGSKISNLNQMMAQFGLSGIGS